MSLKKLQALPKALGQLYILKLFDGHFNALREIVNAGPVRIIADEITDARDQSNLLSPVLMANIILLM